ncbi:MAG: hypothetical protein NTW08_09000 [Gammaproteobacteria bacterium]|nr:hypothetical protein [Gammaproteobacteria bacterium]
MGDKEKRVQVCALEKMQHALRDCTVRKKYHSSRLAAEKQGHHRSKNKHALRP